MSDFGVYENLEWGEDSVAARTAAHRKAVATAIHMAKREFGAYLGNARSPQEWNDRLSQVIGDMSYLVEKHASFTDLDKVVAALRSEAEGRHFAPGDTVQWTVDDPDLEGNSYGQFFGTPEYGNSDTDWPAPDDFGGLRLGPDQTPSSGYVWPAGSELEDGAIDVPVDGLNIDQARAEVEKAVPQHGPGGRHRANRRTADEGIEGFNDQELLDDWPLQDNPVDEAFDGDENDLETSNAPLALGGSEGEQPDLTLTASALPMVPRIATPTFPVPNGNPSQATMPEVEDPNQQRPLTPGAVDTLNQNPVPQRPTMAGRNLPFPVVPRVAPKG